MVQQNAAPAKDVAITEFAYLAKLYWNAPPEISAQVPVAGMYGEADGVAFLAELIFGDAREGGKLPFSVQGIALRPDGSPFSFDLTNVGRPNNENLVFRLHGCDE